MFDLKSRILVVDDMMTMRKLVIKSCKEIGFSDFVEAVDDEEVLQTLRQLQSEQDPNFLRSYLEVFLQPIPNRLKVIGDAIAEQNYGKFASESHALKSSCGNTGARLLAEYAAKLEKLGNEKSVQGASELHKKAAAEFEIVRKLILDLPEFKRPKL